MPSKPLEYVPAPDVLLQNPPVTSGELTPFELKVALYLVAMAYMQRTVDRDTRRDAAAQKAINRIKKTTTDGAVIRRAASAARRKAADNQTDAWPAEIEIHITAREMLRCMGLAATAPTARLGAALDRMLKPVRLPNRAPRLPALLSSWSKSRAGLTIVVQVTDAWFPDQEAQRRKVLLPLPGASKGQAANVLALYLLSHTWKRTGHRTGVARASLMTRLGVERWRAVDRARAALNKFLRQRGESWRWRMSAGEDGTVVFAQVARKKVAKAEVCPSQGEPMQREKQNGSAVEAKSRSATGANPGRRRLSTDERRIAEIEAEEEALAIELRHEPDKDRRHDLTLQSIRLADQANLHRRRLSSS